jgi:IS30 family transposase
MNKVDVKEVERLYISEGLPMHEVARQMGIATGTVFNTIKRNGIPAREQYRGFRGKTHSAETREKIGRAHRGKIVSAESREKLSQAKKIGGIGHKKLHDGYVAVYFPDHPHSTKEGYVMEHDLVMSALIGRWLHPDECVHHINEVKTDNRKENLQLMTNSEHMRYHSSKRWEEKRRQIV